ncbi:hypothetical protein [Mucilaginibacter sp. AK015]|uniref:hypothetical protein n=1 Tax=Mucilaginibacter sp. AK015 TaxID=2723072 RepID=UPI00161433F6|nr:hypothetical protein [Mucilaginibacter sp. AK015]MBB5395084.1 hypothetical protein [Mucilaginibacter sp. AK015]
MTEEEKNNILRTYHDRKAANELSKNLAHPSPGKLRDECLIVYKEKGEPKDDDTLRLFFESPGAEDGYRHIIETVDIDKFRPLEYLLKGRVENPADKHYHMLAWLLPKKRVSPPIPFKLPLIWLIAFVIITAIGGISIFWPGQCMYWAGVQYEKCSCDIKKSDTAIIAFDKEKAALKKITRPDTITYGAIGRVWYIKINNSIEFYTAYGFHPLETRKRLKPITKYIIDKYVKPAALPAGRSPDTTALQTQTKPPHSPPPPERSELPADGRLLNDGGGNFDIALLVINDHNDIENSLSSMVANLYGSLKLSTTTSLFTDRFSHSVYLKGVESANTTILNKLELPSRVKYIIIGRYSNAFESGEFTRYVSRAKLKITIISCVTRSVTDAFRISVANAYDDKEHAEAGAIEKLLTDYQTNHLNPIL